MIDDVNKHSGLRGGGTFKKACKCGNEEMMCSCLGYVDWKCGNALEMLWKWEK